MILCISVLSVVISPFSFLILLIWFFSLCFLMSLANCSSILFIFSKNQLLALLIFAMVSFVSFAFFSALIFKISFLLLTPGFFVSSFCSCFRCAAPAAKSLQPCLTLCDPMNCSTPGLLVHHQLPGIDPNSCPTSQWCLPAISSSVVPFSSYSQSLPASVFSNESTLRMRWPKYWFSALASFLPKNTQDWSPLGWTDWISLQSKGLSRVFSNTTVQKHQFFGTQLSSQSISHIHTWPMEKP